MTGHGGGAVDWSGVRPSAKGNIFSSPGLHTHVNKIVDKPTVFPFAKGIGLMGEVLNTPAPRLRLM